MDLDFWIRSSLVWNGRRFDNPQFARSSCRELAAAAVSEDWKEWSHNRFIDLCGYENVTFANVTTFQIMLMERAKTRVQIVLLFNENDWVIVPEQLKQDIADFLMTIFNVKMQWNTRRTHINIGTFEENKIPTYKVTLEGNASVIPAFFWAVLFIRGYIEDPDQYVAFDAHAIRVCKEETDYEVLLDEEIYMHIDAYQDLYDGIQTPPHIMLGLGVGPIRSRSILDRYESRLNGIKAREDFYTTIFLPAIERTLHDHAH